MNRKEAITVIKEIFEECHLIEGKSLKLLPPKENNTLSNTFQVHVQNLHTNDNQILQLCIESIEKEHRLAVKDEDGWLIIYKPYPIISEP
jgi:hypothetical protein